MVGTLLYVLLRKSVILLVRERSSNTSAGSTKLWVPVNNLFQNSDNDKIHWKFRNVQTQLEKNMFIPASRLCSIPSMEIDIFLYHYETPFITQVLTQGIKNVCRDIILLYSTFLVQVTVAQFVSLVSLLPLTVK